MPSDIDGLVADLQNVIEAGEDDEQLWFETDIYADWEREHLNYDAAPYSPPPLRGEALAKGSTIVERLYPPLTLVENAENGINFNHHIAPTSYQESFRSRWSTEDQSHGYLNPIYSYGGTEREASLSFTLPAMTVAQARDNLSQCSKLSRTVYGRYRHHNTSTENADTIRVFSGERRFTVDFGSLIREERAVVSAFTFAVDPDAGVFDYEAGGDSDVTHATQGLVLPRAVSVDITFIFIHDHPLGFGGRNRIEGTGNLKWAENRNRDWPHGTGPIPVRGYMSEDTIDWDNPTDEDVQAMIERANGRVYDFESNEQ